MSELGIKALDKYKLQVELEKPVPYINELLALNTLDKYKLQVELEKPVPYINELLALNTFDPQNSKIAKNMEKNMVQKPIEQYIMGLLK